MKSDAEIVQLIDDCFASLEKPRHFTNHTHCDECAEHDTVLRSHDRWTLGLDDVGNPAWDPFCFFLTTGDRLLHAGTGTSGIGKANA